MEQCALGRRTRNVSLNLTPCTLDPLLESQPTTQLTHAPTLLPGTWPSFPSRTSWSRWTCGGGTTKSPSSWPSTHSARWGHKALGQSCGEGAPRTLAAWGASRRRQHLFTHHSPKAGRQRLVRVPCDALQRLISTHAGQERYLRFRGTKVCLVSGCSHSKGTGGHTPPWRRAPTSPSSSTVAKPGAQPRTSRASTNSAVQRRINNPHAVAHHPGNCRTPQGPLRGPLHLPPPYLSSAPSSPPCSVPAARSPP